MGPLRSADQMAGGPVLEPPARSGSLLFGRNIGLFRRHIGNGLVHDDP